MVVSTFTLVRSKLLVPSPSGLLHRPQVCQVIERGIECKLTLVSAPAGYGKTSALVDFAQHSSLPVCWYTADERDCDLSMFIEYLVGAIGEHFRGFGRRTQAALASLSGDLFRDPTAIVGEVANEMLEIDTPFVVVVDNYEALGGAFGIQPFVRRLLEVLPSNCHLMLGSRILPDVPVTHLVAKRQLVGLTTRDLRFSPQEIRGLLQLSHIEISNSQAEAIAANSEGWITGVLLLSDLLRDEARAALLDAERATAETYNYLAREVLDRQPPDVQHFLRTSAVLREMSPRLCREILQMGGAGALLAEVERRNLFVTRFGKGGAATYRYHNLFRDFLHEQLRQRDPDRYAELHLRAAKRFERDNEVEDATYHYLAAENYPGATVLVERVAMEWFTRGRVETLLRWADALPEEARSKAPRLSLYQSKVLTDRYDYEGARQALAYAEVGFTARGDMARLARVHDQRAALALFEGRYEDTIAEAQAALEMLGQDEVMERAGAQRFIGRAYVGLGRLAEGVAKLQDALVLFRQVGSPYDVVNLLQDLTLAFAPHGRFDEAAACLNEALAVGRRLGSPAQLAGVFNNLGMLHYDRGEYREALALYEEGLAAVRRGGDLRGQANMLDGMASIYRDIGAYQRAAAFYNAAWQIAQESRPGLAVRILTAQADMYRWQGEHARALAVLERARRLAEEKGLDLEGRGLLPVAEGITLIESGEVETGLRFLSAAVRFLEGRQARRELARARFLLAKAHLLAGDKPPAVAELRRAMNLADEIGTDQFAVVEGQHAEEFLRFGLAEGVTACRAIIEKVQQLRAFGEELVQEDVAVEGRVVGRLEIYALGEGQVVRDGNLVSSSAWRTAIVKEVFFYIFLHGPLERDVIGVVFWPDVSAKKMVDSFHTTLYRMRRAVGADAVVVEEGQYRLGDVDYWFDVQEFEMLIERARLLPPGDWQTENLWRRAVTLYRGDFLPEVERVWCVPRRETLWEMYLEALLGVGRCHEARRDFEGAIAWYRRALEMDELREDTCRHIMRCYAKAGRRSDALAQYHHCQELLKRELDVEPAVETRRLYEQIAGKGLG
ncbi:MAG: BTAD domain-containing putative transcriptional regulator [Chloroflexota bacterium]|nr:BTAD domain-containing putative transcriptional regulator [Chloroflexota bacterium]